MRYLLWELQNRPQFLANDHRGSFLVQRRGFDSSENVDAKDRKQTPNHDAYDDPPNHDNNADYPGELKHGTSTTVVDK